MSEYQYYEFLALDAPLTDAQMKEVRQVSTRARITPTSFVNEYHWGDFKGDIKRFLTKYYDAFVYVANWGTHDLRFRLPASGVDVKQIKPYCVSDSLYLQIVGDSVLLGFESREEEAWHDWEEGEGWMSSLAPLRAEILSGDLRGLYLGWLAGVLSEDVDDDDEPPVPAGLGELSGPQQALVEFLRIDGALLDAAAEASPPLTAAQDMTADLRAWVASLPPADKDALLVRFAQEPPMTVQRELLRRFRQDSAPAQPADRPPRRTAGQLREEFERRAEELARQEAQRKAQEKARRQAEAERARQKRLDELATREDAAWRQVDALIAERKPKSYDQAVALLRDLRALAARENRPESANARLHTLRQTHHAKSTFLQRMDKAGL